MTDWLLFIAVGTGIALIVAGICALLFLLYLKKQREITREQLELLLGVKDGNDNPLRK